MLKRLASHQTLTLTARRDKTILGQGATLSVESLQVAIGGLHFHSGTLVEGVAPPWIVVLWAQFAATLRYCLRWLGRDWRVAMSFGALGGPLAYWLGERLGAVQVDGLTAWALLALLWGVAIPVLSRVSARVGATPGRYRGFR